jgi:YHS domain-containing protein
VREKGREPIELVESLTNKPDEGRKMTMRNASRYLGILLALLMVTALATAQTEATVKSGAADTDVKVSKDTKPIPYPLNYCIVSGEKLGQMGDVVTKVYDGREVKFCCNMCPKTFEKSQAKYFKKLDNAIATEQKASYPLETCVVTGEKLGKMGDPVDYVYDNRLVRFCCSNCIATFKKDPAKYMKMIDDAAAPKAAETPQK